MIVKLALPIVAAAGAAALIAAVGARAAPAAPATPDGHELFEANCSACHQSGGEGIPGAFPALAGDAFVTGDPAKPIATVLNGRGGMPSFRDGLSDAEIAAVLSYARASWGNKAAPIAPAQVAALRQGAQADPARPIPAH